MGSKGIEHTYTFTFLHANQQVWAKVPSTLFLWGGPLTVGVFHNDSGRFWVVVEQSQPEFYLRTSDPSWTRTCGGAYEPQWVCLPWSKPANPMREVGKSGSKCTREVRCPVHSPFAVKQGYIFFKWFSHIMLCEHFHSEVLFIAFAQ